MPVVAHLDPLVTHWHSLVLSVCSSQLLLMCVEIGIGYTIVLLENRLKLFLKVQNAWLEHIYWPHSKGYCLGIPNFTRERTGKDVYRKFTTLRSPKLNHLRHDSMILYKRKCACDCVKIKLWWWDISWVTTQCMHHHHHLYTHSDIFMVIKNQR